MQKEIITRKLLLRELKKKYVGGLRFYPVAAIVLLVSAVVLMWGGLYVVSHASALSGYLQGFLEVFAAALLLFVAVSFTVQYPVEAIRRLKKVNDAALYIAADRVIGMEEEHDYLSSPRIRAFREDNNTYWLHFSSYDKYAIDRGENYKWSREMCMSARGVYRSTSVGDEFYLVMLERERIEMIFNKKFFVLQDESENS